LVRAGANVADDLRNAGFDDAEAANLRQRVEHFVKLRDVIRLASGEHLDLKAYEADMRHLIDTYIEAKEPRTISPFGEMPLLELIVKSGIAAAINEQLGGLKANHDAVAETIENNIRRKIIKEQLTDPAFYASMSKLLEEIIELRKQKAIGYEAYLRRIAALAAKVQSGHDDDTPEPLKRSPGLRAIYNNLRDAPAETRLETALRVDEAVRNARPDDWRGHQPREQMIKRALYSVVGNDEEVERLFPVIKAQSEY
jgi:type I restriction enzyme R subunit